MPDELDALAYKDDYNPEPLHEGEESSRLPDPIADVKTAQSDNQHYGRAFKELQESGTRLKDLYKQREQALAPIREDMETMAGQAPQQVPRVGKELEEQPRPPDVKAMKQEFMENANGLMVAFSALAMFGAMRNGPTAALSFLGGAFKGLQEGQADQAAQAWKQFEAESGRVIQKNKDIMGEYRAIMENKKLDFDQKVELNKIVASKWDDRIAHEILERKDFVTMEQLFAKRDAANIQLQRALIGLQNAKNKAEAAAGEMQADRREKLLDQMKDRIKRAMEGGPKPELGMGQGKNALLQREILGEAYKAIGDELGMTQAEIAQKLQLAQARTKALGSSMTSESRIGQSVNELLGFLEPTKQALAQLPRGQVLRWNLAQEKWENETGSPQLAAANVWITDVINAYSVAAARGGQGAVDLRKQANALLSSNNSPEAAIATLNTMYRTAVIALRAPEQTRRQMQGQEPYPQDPGAQAPPAPGAKKAADGNWYVENPPGSGKFFMVKP